MSGLRAGPEQRSPPNVKARCA